MPERDLHLAVALDGAGWHPPAWREPDARPSQLFTAGYWVRLVAEAERGGPARAAARRRRCRRADHHHDHADRVRSYELLAGEWSQR